MVHQQDAATHSLNPASGDAGAAAHPFWQSEQITNRVDPYSFFLHGSLLVPCRTYLVRPSEDISQVLLPAPSQYMCVDYVHAGAGHDA